MSEKRKENRIIYPLVSAIPMGKPDINAYWHNMPFRLQLKGYQGNCKVCWKKSLRKLLTIARENPKAFISFQEMESQFEAFIPIGRKGKPNLPLRFYRGNLSVAQILQMSKEDFEEATDDSILLPRYKQTNLFNVELDTSFGCSESCDAFS